MIRKRALSLAAAGLCTCLAAQSPPTPAPAPRPAPSGADQRVAKLIEEVQTLQQKQRSFEALRKLDEADAIQPDSAILANIRGSIYTAPPLRDFAKARECFLKAEKLLPQAFEPRFNLTELLYVEGRYAEAEDQFVKLLDRPKLREEVRHIIQFKVVVCRLKQGKAAEAEAMAKAFTFMDDTPAYYFAKAAAAFQKGDKEEAGTWVAKATRIFKPAHYAVYVDTLMEAGWIGSVSSGPGKP